MIKGILVGVTVVVMSIIILGHTYVFQNKLNDEPANDNNNIQDCRNVDDYKLSLWTVYWDDEDLFTEIKERKKEISNLSFFGAYFDSENRLFIPEKIVKANKDINEMYSERHWKHCLTIVNDKIKEDGSSSLKDTQLLKTLFESPESVEKHITEIISMTLEGNYDGVEIDYEAIRKDTDLWNKFIVFCEKLYIETTKNNLNLRIILEPGAPMDTMKFPEGPEYTIMCYNLYGYGTDPGPKANSKFLKEIVNKAQSLPGEKEFILATGGFSWSKLGDVKSITTEVAEEQLKATGVKEKRDKESQCLYYKYQDENGDSHTVWYADDKTISHWIKTLKDLGVKKYGIWRIGA